MLHLPGAVNKLSSLANLSIDGRIHIQLSNLIGDAEHVSCISKQQSSDKVMLLTYYDFKLLNIMRIRSTYGAPFRCVSLSDFPFLAELKLINLGILNIPDDIDH